MLSNLDTLAILAGTDSYRSIKKQAANSSKKLGPVFHRQPEDIYVNGAFRESQLLNKNMYLGEQGVHRLDEFTKMELRENVDKLHISHLSNNRNFDNYPNFIATSFPDLEKTFSVLAEIFLKGLVQVGRSPNKNRQIDKFKKVLKAFHIKKY